MNNFETVNLTIYNRLYSYKNGRAPKDLDDMICHYMSYFAKVHKNHRRNEEYEFSTEDIEMIYNHIYMDKIGQLLCGISCCLSFRVPC